MFAISFSCTSASFTWTDNSYHTQDWIKSCELNALVVKEVRYLRRQVTLVFTVDDVKKDVSLCKLDVTVMNLTAVAGSVGFFKLKLKSSLASGHVFINCLYGKVHTCNLRVGISLSASESDDSIFLTYATLTVLEKSVLPID